MEGGTSRNEKKVFQSPYQSPTLPTSEVGVGGEGVFQTDDVGQGGGGVQKGSFC